MGSDDPATRDLIDRAKRGDREAFEALHDRYARSVYRYVRFRLGDPDDAEDVVQGVFLTVVQHLPRYEHRGRPFGAWLFRIARNAVIDQVRRRPEHVPIDRAIDLPSPAPSPDEAALFSADVLAVHRALDALTAEQREVIALRFLAGLSASEAGAVMGKGEGTIRALQFRALGSLRRELGLPPRPPDREK